MRRLYSFVWHNVLRYLFIGILSSLCWLGIGLEYIVYYSCKIVETLTRVAIAVIYLLGVLVTVSLLASSLLLFMCTVFTEVGLSISNRRAYYEIATRIFAHPWSWAAVTIIVGTTVALSHLKNLEVNRARYCAEMQDRWKAEEE